MIAVLLGLLTGKTLDNLRYGASVVLCRLKNNSIRPILRVFCSLENLQGEEHPHEIFNEHLFMDPVGNTVYGNHFDNLVFGADAGGPRHCNRSVNLVSLSFTWALLGEESLRSIP